METKDLITLTEKLMALANKAATTPAKMTCRNSRTLGETAMELVNALWLINDKEELKKSPGRVSQETRDVNLMEALRNGGVDTWEGYGFAIESWEALAGRSIDGTTDESSGGEES